MQQNTLWRLNAQTLKNFRMLQRKLNHLPDFLNLVLKTANVLISNFRNSLILYFNSFRIENNLSLLSNNNRKLGICFSNNKLQVTKTIRHHGFFHHVKHFIKKRTLRHSSTTPSSTTQRNNITLSHRAAQKTLLENISRSSDNNTLPRRSNNDFLSSLNLCFPDSNKLANRSPRV